MKNAESLEKNYENVPCYQYVSKYKTQLPYGCSCVAREVHLFKTDKIQSIGVNGMIDSLLNL